MEIKKFNMILTAVLVVVGVINALLLCCLGEIGQAIVPYVIIGVGGAVAIIAFMQVLNQNAFQEHNPFIYWIGVGGTAVIPIFSIIFAIGMFPEMQSIGLVLTMSLYQLIMPLLGAFLAMMWRSLVNNPIKA